MMLLRCLLSFTFLFCSLCAVSKEDINPELLTSLFGQFLDHDQDLAEYIEDFPFAKYDIYLVENRDIYYVDDVPDLIKDFVRKGIMWEVHHFPYLAKYARPNTVAVDIGAHIGTQALHISRFVGPGGKVYVFEPQIKIFSELVINMHLNDVHNMEFHRKAVGDTHTTIEMAKHCPTNEGGVGIGSGGIVLSRLLLIVYI